MACESGEECPDIACVDGCLSDCPIVRKACPAGNGTATSDDEGGDPRRPCSGNGVCLSGSGTCQCFAGYVAHDCTGSMCASGYLQLKPAGKCVFLPGALSSCDDGVRSSQEDGVDCGGVCSASCSTAGASFLSKYRVVVLASAGGIGVILLGVVGALAYRVATRTTALPSGLGGVKDASGIAGPPVHGGRTPQAAQGAGGRSGPSRTVSRAAVRAKAVHVRPWDAGIGATAGDSDSDWLSKTTMVSPSASAAPPGPGPGPTGRGPSHHPQSVAPQPSATSASGTAGRGPSTIPSRRQVVQPRADRVQPPAIPSRRGSATGRTRASSYSSAVTPDDGAESLILF
jgi:hypothetical protein